MADPALGGLRCPDCRTPLWLGPEGCCPRCGRAAALRGERLPDFLGGDVAEAEAILAWPSEFVKSLGPRLLNIISGATPDEATLAELRHWGLADGSGPTNLGRHLAYHLREYDRQEADDRIPAALNRAGLGPGARVLDVGGGAGQTLRLLERWGPAERVALDIDATSLAMGLRMAEARGQSLGFVRASAHALPFPKGRFTHIICRVGLNYMHQGRALHEMARVLSPGGVLYGRVEGPGFDLRLLGRTSGLRDRASLTLELAAGLVLAATGRQPTPGRRRGIGRAFATLGHVCRTLARAGCDIVCAEETGRHRGLPLAIEFLARRRVPENTRSDP